MKARATRADLVEHVLGVCHACASARRSRDPPCRANAARRSATRHEWLEQRRARRAASRVPDRNSIGNAQRLDRCAARVICGLPRHVQRKRAEYRARPARSARVSAACDAMRPPNECPPSQIGRSVRCGPPRTPPQSPPARSAANRRGAAGRDERKIESQRRDAVPLEPVRERLHVPMPHPCAGAVREHERRYGALRLLPDHRVARSDAPEYVREQARRAARARPSSPSIVRAA